MNIFNRNMSYHIVYVLAALVLFIAIFGYWGWRYLRASRGEAETSCDETGPEADYQLKGAGRGMMPELLSDEEPGQHGKSCDAYTLRRPAGRPIA